MGCCSSKRRTDEGYEEVTSGHMGVDYFQKKSIDPSNYICQQLNGVTVVKEPGQLDGQSFHIEDCKDSVIVLVDHTAAVTIDLCTNCHIFIGPCKGSIFMRESKGCTVMASCHQFRARDCIQCSYQLHCVTQPVVENCSDITFGCFHAYYPHLQEHLKSSNLSPFNNNWYSVHDFTPSQSGNWTTLGGKGWSLPTVNEFPSLSFDSTTTDGGIIPATIGTDYNDDENTEICIVMLLEDMDNERGLHFIQAIRSKLNVLVTKDTKMKSSGMQHFFAGNDFAPTNLKDGLQVECFVLQGNNAISTCTQSLLKDGQSNDSFNAYCSPNLGQAMTDYQRLCHLIDNGLIT